MGPLVRATDFETTGTEPPADVMEMGCCDVTPAPLASGRYEVGKPIAFLYGADRVPPETRAIHHIAPVEIAGMPKWRPDIVIDDARHDGAIAIAAHHADFEGKWLAPAIGDLPLVCTYKCALRLWPDAPSHSNQCLRYLLEEMGLTSVDPVLAQPAHRAGPDAYATACLLAAELAQVPLKTLIQWTREPKLLPTLPIGKQRGAKWPDVEEGFLRWMLRTDDMDPDLKWNAQRELNRRANSGTEAKAS